MTWVDFIGQVVIGGGSIVSLALLYRYSDALSDGNIDAKDK